MTSKREAAIAFITNLTGARPGGQSRTVKLLVSALPKIGRNSQPDEVLVELLTAGGWGPPNLARELAPDSAEAGKEVLLPVAALAIALSPPRAEAGESGGKGRRTAGAVLRDAREMLSEGAAAAAYRTADSLALTRQASELGRHLRVQGREVQVFLPPACCEGRRSNLAAGTGGWIPFDEALHMDDLVIHVQSLVAGDIAESSAASVAVQARFDQLLDQHDWTRRNQERRALAADLAAGWMDLFGERELDALSALDEPSSLLDWTHPGAQRWMCAGAVAARDFFDGPHGWAGQTAESYAWRRSESRYGSIPVDDEGAPLPHSAVTATASAPERRPARRSSGTNDSPNPIDHPNEWWDDALHLHTRRVLDAEDPATFEALVHQAVVHARGRMIKKATREYLTRRHRVDEPGQEWPFALADPDSPGEWVFQSMQALSRGLSNAWAEHVNATQHRGPAGRPAAAAENWAPSHTDLLLACAVASAADDPDAIQEWLQDLVAEDVKTAVRAVCQGRAPAPGDWPAIVDAISAGSGHVALGRDGTRAGRTKRVEIPGVPLDEDMRPRAAEVLEVAAAAAQRARSARERLEGES